MSYECPREEGDKATLKILRSGTPYILITPVEFEIDRGVEIATYCTWKGIDIQTQSLPDPYSVIKILRDAADLLEEEAMK